MGIKTREIGGIRTIRLRCDTCGLDGPIAFNRESLLKHTYAAGWEMWSNGFKDFAACKRCIDTGCALIERNPINPSWPSCAICGDKFKPPKKNSKYCSHACAQRGSRRADRPSRRELEKLVWEMTTVKIAEMYGVSDKAVTKWCRRYKIDKPPRGFWQRLRAGKETPKPKEKSQ